MKFIERQSNNWIDRTGSTFGKLLVLGYLGNSNWLCKCSCGKETTVKAGQLASGHTRSCGCKRGKTFKNYLGTKRGKLTCTASISEGVWEWTCDCGNKVLTTNSQEVFCKKSCGCLLKEVAVKRGLAHRKPNNVTINSQYYAHKSNAKSRNQKPLQKEHWLKIVFEPCFYCGETDTRNHATGSVYQKMKNLSLTPELTELYAVNINGVDRLDSSIGYELDNCVPCCSTCNRMKSDFEYSKFIDKIIKINKYHVKRKKGKTVL